MRKLISMAAVAFMVIGATSCSKTGPESGDYGTGNVKVTFAIDGDEITSRAVASNAKPTTTWANVNRMIVLFVNPTTNVVVDARTVTIPAAQLAGSTDITETLVDVKATSTGWDTYIVGNYPNDPLNNGWTVGNVVGKNISTQLAIAAPKITVVDDASTLTDDDGFSLAPAGTTYGEAPEIFVAKQPAANVKVPNDGTTLTVPDFNLARAVSMIRIRVDQNHTDAPSNANVDFSGAKGVSVIRRATTTYSLPGSYAYNTADAITGTTFPGTYAPTPPVNTNVFWSNKGKQTAEPASGYVYGATPSRIITGTAFEFWNEYKIWAGGNRNTTAAAEIAKRFDIVLSGVTIGTSYVPVGATAPVAAGTRVWWNGQVDAVVGPNQILELDLTLKTAGNASVTPPEVGEYGNIAITVNLLGWGDIINTDLPM